MIPAEENSRLTFSPSTCQVVVSAMITAGIAGNCSLNRSATRSDTPAPIQSARVSFAAASAYSMFAFIALLCLCF